MKLEGVITMNETVLLWIEEFSKTEHTQDEIRSEIDNIRGTIRNEHLWELGCSGVEENPHTQNIEELMEYLEWLKEQFDSEASTQLA